MWCWRCYAGGETVDGKCWFCHDDAHLYHFHPSAGKWGDPPGKPKTLTPSE